MSHVYKANKQDFIIIVIGVIDLFHEGDKGKSSDMPKAMLGSSRE